MLFSIEVDLYCYGLIMVRLARILYMYLLAR
jgi:hypothetical protein